MLSQPLLGFLIQLLFCSNHSAIGHSDVYVIKCIEIRVTTKKIMNNNDNLWNTCSQIVRILLFL